MPQQEPTLSYHIRGRRQLVGRSGMWYWRQPCTAEMISTFDCAIETNNISSLGTIVPRHNNTRQAPPYRFQMSPVPSDGDVDCITWHRRELSQQLQSMTAITPTYTFVAKHLECPPRELVTRITASIQEVVFKFASNASQNVNYALACAILNKTSESIRGEHAYFVQRNLHPDSVDRTPQCHARQHLGLR
jgi:hypothetical protein